MTDTPVTPDSGIFPVTIEDEMRRSYLDYAMSVIVARALPDVRDGLKPVHRRILYTMKSEGYDWNRGYRKSARAVGDVMGQYHPHGDTAIYDAMVRLAQEFSMRLPLIDGQGNFGSMDGDRAAAMRYTEARLQRVASEALLEDIDKDTVDFQPNYDETTEEPVVLPARYPNLLVNGAGGIAVGMATNIPPHNLGEVIDGCCAFIDDPDITIDGLLEHIPGPDFPTGGVILGRAGIRDAYHTGRGSVRLRGRVEIEEVRKDRFAIVATEIPYQVNKARMVERIAELVRDKSIEGISDLRDESDRHGVRVVIEIRRDFEPDVVLNQVYRFSPLQSSFGVNMVALNRGRPELLDLKSIISAFIEFREEVITRRTSFELNKARERAHLLVGLAIAVANIDDVIALIRGAPDPVAAREALMARDWPARDVEALIVLIDEPGRGISEAGTYRLSEAQAKGILELRLQRLTGLERDKIAEDLQGLARQIVEFLEILQSRELLMKILRGELLEMKERYSTPRRTEIVDFAGDQDDEDLIQREDMVVTVSDGGYVKRVPLSTYRAQRRGGKGRAGMSTREEDSVDDVFVCNTHTPVLFFTSRGMVYRLKVYRLPVGTPQARGKALVNLLPLAEGETLSAFMPMPEDESVWAQMYVVFATSQGDVRRNRLSDFVQVRANGKIAMKLEEGGPYLVSARPCSEEQDILLATAKGKCIRFPVSDLRVFTSRNSTGVRGIRLTGGDSVISMSVLEGAAGIAIEERDLYLRYANARRRGRNAEDADSARVAEETMREIEQELPPERIETLTAKEQFILSVSADGYGKRTSAYEYRQAGRGGQGIANLDLSRGSKGESTVVAAFPVAREDQVMLVTDGGQLIRTPVFDVRVASRMTRGVLMFRVEGDERVVSVARLPSDDDVEDEEGIEEEGGAEEVAPSNPGPAED